MHLASWSVYNTPMHKLVILLFATKSPTFDTRWPEFLHAAERIPGLRREATSHVSRLLYGELRCELIHELFFDSFADLDRGLKSPEGERAGQILQAITGGRMVLLLADHSEDELQRIHSFQRAPDSDSQP